MRKHSAANEALKLTLDEQGDTAFIVTLVERPEEGGQGFAAPCRGCDQSMVSIGNLRPGPFLDICRLPHLF